MPTKDQAVTWMQKRIQKRWYKLPIARYYLVNAFYDDKFTAEQKQYIASLIRAIEDISENDFRVSPWYEVKNKGANKGQIARLYGQIDSSIDTKTANLIASNPDLHTIELVYVPWSFHDINNHKAGRMIRDAWLNTVVKKFGFIASGGTDLLMAWVNRTVEEWANVWVHAWTSPTHPTSWTLTATDPAHLEYINYFTEMWIESSLYRWTIQNTRPESIHWLTSDELDQYGF